MFDDHRLWANLLSFSMLQGVLLAFVLLVKHSQRPQPRLFLASALLGNSLVILFWFLLASDSFRVFPQSHALARFFSWTLAPLLYFHIRTLFNADDRPRWWLVLLVIFLPGTLRLVRDLIHGYDLERIAMYLDWALRDGALPGAKAGTLIAILRTSFNFLFTGLTWRLFYRAWRSAKAGNLEFSPAQKIWLGSMVVLVTAFNVSQLQGNLASLESYALPLSSAYTSTLLRCAIVQIVALAALLVPDSLVRTAGEIIQLNSRAPLPVAETEELVGRLAELMAAEAPYRDPRLRVAGLAKMLGVRGPVLSQVFSEGLQTSFAEFVNGYRVNEAKRLLRSDQADRYTLSAIGQEAGFASRSSFNRVFRQQAGVTPSDYRNAPAC
jgi:AraC-like DNA-binding protein